MNSIEASRINGGNGSKKRAAHDFYPTPPEVTIALINFLRLPRFTNIWEPASGEGDMVRIIRRAAELNVPFAFLLKSTYWHAEKRRKLYEEITPSYILPLTWRPDFLFKQQSGGAPLMDMAWNVWDLRSRGAAQYIPIGRPACGKRMDIDNG